MVYKTLVANSATQQRWTIDSSAHTLGELKEEFRQNNIPFDGLSITEGLCTKAELVRDDAEIPTSQRTVAYNGQTYSRVFLITNSHKNISLGGFPLERKLFGQYIKDNNLGEAIKNKFGDNWTRVKTFDLIDFFKSHEERNTAQLEEVRKEVNNLGKEKEKEEEVNTPETKATTAQDAPNADMVELLFTWVKYMANHHILLPEDVKVLSALIAEFSENLKNNTQVMSESDLKDLLNSIEFKNS